MTADSPAQTTREPVPGRSDRAALGLPAPTILSMCDSLLGEAGRRHHMFTWLRAPGAGAGEWLAVDAYYPRARLVVICRSGPGPHDSLYRELIPAHGLGLLTLDPAALGSDREAVEASLARKFLDLSGDVARGRSRPSATPAARNARLGTQPARNAPARNAPAPEWTSDQGRAHARRARICAGLGDTRRARVRRAPDPRAVSRRDQGRVRRPPAPAGARDRARAAVAGAGHGRGRTRRAARVGVRVRDRRRPGRGLGRCCSVARASTSSRRRSRGCSRCSPARSRCSRSSSAAKEPHVLSRGP